MKANTKDFGGGEQTNGGVYGGGEGMDKGCGGSVGCFFFGGGGRGVQAKTKRGVGVNKRQLQTLKV